MAHGGGDLHGLAGPGAAVAFEGDQVDVGARARWNSRRPFLASSRTLRFGTNHNNLGQHEAGGDGDDDRELEAGQADHQGEQAGEDQAEARR